MRHELFVNRDLMLRVPMLLRPIQPIGVRRRDDGYAAIRSAGFAVTFVVGF